MVTSIRFLQSLAATLRAADFKPINGGHYASPWVAYLENDPEDFPADYYAGIAKRVVIFNRGDKTYDLKTEQGYCHGHSLFSLARMADDPKIKEVDHVTLGLPIAEAGVYANNQYTALVREAEKSVEAHRQEVHAFTTVVRDFPAAASPA